MKNLLIAAIAVFTIGASAQDVNFKSKRGENFLPEKGDWAIGFNADGIFQYVGNSFNGNVDNGAPSVTYNKGNFGTFVGKKFITDKTAYRVIANLKLISDEVVDAKLYPTPVTTGTITSTSIISNETSTSGFDLVAGLGKEWRRGKTRLQGFYGADVFVRLNSTSTTVNNSTEVTSVDTAPTPDTTNLFNTSNETITKSGFGFGLGAQGFLGAEYFLFPKIAIGAQYTYGVNLFFNGKGKVDTTTSATGVPSTSTSKDNGSGSNIGLTGVGVSSINLTLHF